VEVDPRGVGSGKTKQHRIRREPETRSGVENFRRRCALEIGPRVMWEREIGHSELHRFCPQPLSPFCIRAVRQGPTTISWLAPPIRARGQTGLRLGLMSLDARWSQSNILLLHLNLILILVLNLILIFSTIFITDQYIEQLRHNSQLRTIRLNNYHTHFHSEKDSHLILRPLVSKNHRLSLKPMPATCSLNTLGGKPFLNGSASICLVLMCSRLMV
jgi:hypothetical protein